MTHFTTREQFFRHYLHDDDAVELNLLFCEVLHTWDDLIDKDKPVTDAQVSQAFRAALVQIPGNAFYQQHLAQLHPLIDHFILSWLTATSMERQGDIEGLRIAYVARSDYMALFLRSIQLVSGFDFATQHASEIRRRWHQEGWDGYLVNLTCEKVNRQERHPT